MMRVVSAIIVLLFAATNAWAQARGEVERLIKIPRKGTTAGMVTRLCAPDTPGPHRLVVFNHGRAGKRHVDRRQRPFRCGLLTQPFTSRGYLVAIPLRRGYGATGGADRERGGSCRKRRFVQAANAGADDVRAAIRYLRRKRLVVHEKTIVLGQSVGGLVTIALAARNVPGVATYINFAGGHGATGKGRNRKVCASHRLVSAAARFGRTARIPMLWIYTGNDWFFGPKLSRRMHRAFVKAGGKARYVLVPKFTNFNVYDGHALFYGAGGVTIWEPIVIGWLKARGILE